MSDSQEPVRVGVIGCGDIARRAHLPAFAALEDVEIVALADVDLAKAQEAARGFGVRQVFADYEKLLALSEVQAVSICTPPATHHPIAIAAAQAGKHILCEKPMAMSLAQAQAMTCAARARGVLLAICFPWKYYRLHGKVKELVGEGICGQVYRLTHRSANNSAAWLAQETASHRPWLSVRQGRVVGRLSSAEEGLLTQAVIEAAYRSSQERREVSCELLGC